MLQALRPGPPQGAARGIEVVLFDLGGVLVDVSGASSLRALAGIESEDALWRRWIEDPWVRRFERGRCSAKDFAAGLVEAWGLAVGAEVFLEAFASWPIGPMAGAADLVREVGERVGVGCLSNTNVLHFHSSFSHWAILAAFDFRFLSFELGLVKPDAELFDRVEQALDVARDRVLFLDDNPINVEGARSSGFAATLARGVAQARHALVEAGVLAR